MNILIKDLWLILGEDRRKIPWMVLLFVSVSLLELIGIGLIGPYVALVMEPDHIEKHNSINIINELRSEFSPNQLILGYGIALCALFIFKGGIIILINRLIYRFSWSQIYKGRSRLLEMYQSMPYTTYIKRNSAEYIQALTANMGRYVGNLELVLRLTTEVIVTLGITIFLIWLHPAVFFLFFLLFGGASMSYYWYFRKKISVAGLKSVEHNKLAIKSIKEGVDGFKEIRILGFEDYFRENVRLNSKIQIDQQIFSQIVRGSARYLMEGLFVISIVIVITVTLASGQNFQEIFPIVAIFVVASFRLVPAVNLITTGVVQLRYGQVAVANIAEEFRSYENVIKRKKADSLKRKEVEPFKRLQLVDVQFTYPDSTSPALEQINLTISAGESLGLIGISGAGKTTLVDVLLGLLIPEEGNILYNGMPIMDDLEAWQRQVAYIPQDIFLLDETIKENITIGVSKFDYEESRVRGAIEQSQLTELVSKLPDGLDTRVGEHGIRLSGGQRQRLALARAFFNDRTVLILDEATSALDAETEAHIVSEIKQLKGKKTLIVIAHRQSTVEHCDRICKLADGRLVQVPVL